LRQSSRYSWGILCERFPSSHRSHTISPSTTPTSDVTMSSVRRVYCR
jgi:hypothetical protein